MKFSLFTFCLAFLCTFQSIAQTSATTSFGDDFIKAWKRHKVYTLRLAEAMPDNHFSYKPTEEVRSFGQLLIHITGANYMFSSLSGGQDFPIDKENLKAEGKSKEPILKMLGESFDYAEGILKTITQADLAKTSPWGNPIEASTTRTYAEILHVMREHAAHHRGQMTVYLRLKGVTPPGFID